ncbi:MAG: 2,3-bisphosphoglycerate-independent phosphoglycerate mutase [Ureaplasma sp.]|nr:2,3-bisphosphoglycerate-independent phosphoglycerate mutase [Ureaplasma sp.]MDE7221982.1 2,3-bisphosphoglycerate-independent phosphoglycerate mutase [Ureaplasma sp.]
MKKVILAILDGFGIGENNESTNAIYAANSDFFSKLLKDNKFCKLDASEELVGLKKKQFGNSELGHMTIGSGQTILGINQIFNNLVKENKLEQYLLNQKWVKDCLANDRPIHICGMYSHGEVHSNANHFDELINFFQKHNKNISLHLISDGRDTASYVFAEDLEKLKTKLKNTTKIVSISGRYYAMDRDKNFDRTEKFYNAMQCKYCSKIKLEEYLQKEKELLHDDEFIEPTSFDIDENYKIQNNDFIIFLNYRADRIKQIIHFYKNNQLFDYQPNRLTNNYVISICEHSNTPIDYSIIDNQKITKNLGKILSEHKIKQLNIAETEKYAHVTFFFNSGDSKNYENQEFVLIPSKKVPTYDLAPEMSANEITKKIEELINQYDFIVVNYANADMVGHTGNFNATKQAIKVLDKQCQILYNLVDKYDGTLLITSDHGNADLMVDNKGNIVKTHSIAKVPLFVLSNEFEIKQTNGKLQDIAPSILYMYNIPKPSEMDGINLLTKK